MIATSDFRKGAKILFRNEPFLVLDYQHVKPGKGGAFVRTKMKSMITGLIHEETFRSGEKFEEPDIEYKDMQYLYEEDGLYHFMDQDSYDQISFNKKQIVDILPYLKEQSVYAMLYFEGRPISVNPPMHMFLKVVETTPGVKGDTAQGAGSKPAKLETGVTVQVPLFVQEGDTIKVDTREGIYIERVLQ